MSEVKINQEAVQLLSDILCKSDLSEIEYSVDNVRIKVARATPAISSAQVVVPASSAVYEPERSVSESCEDRLDDHPGAVKAQMVGTVYLASSPDAANYVSVGSRVNKGDILCIIEAMKVMNYIKAHKDGVVEKVLVHNGQPIEYGECLFIIG